MMLFRFSSARAGNASPLDIPSAAQLAKVIYQSCDAARG